MKRQEDIIYRWFQEELCFINWHLLRNWIGHLKNLTVYCYSDLISIFKYKWVTQVSLLFKVAETFLIKKEIDKASLPQR